MKRDFSQPFTTPKPAWVYVLAEYRMTGQFLLVEVFADDIGDEWYTVLGFELPDGENMARLLAKSLDRHGLILESFQELCRETKVNYSLADDTPGEQHEYICLHALVEPVRPYKSEDSKIEFVPLEKLAHLASNDVGDLPSIIGTGAAAIDARLRNASPAQDASDKGQSRSVTNFTIIDQTKLKSLLEPFVPGMSPYITPIKYEALTPDLYCLLFRTRKDDKYFYFVLLEYDFIPELEIAKNIINKWHGEVIEFISPHDSQDSGSQDIRDLRFIYDKVYKGLLARVERPTGDGCWAANFILGPGDDVDAALSDLSDDQQTAIKRGLAEIKNKAAIVSVYVKPEGGYELFFE